MGEPEKVKTKRRFWQIHLSTALLLLFLFGFDMMLWHQTTYLSEYDFHGVHYYSTDFGFPISVHWQSPLTFNRAVGGILFNLPFHLAGLGFIVAMSEYLIRGEGRKP